MRLNNSNSGFTIVELLIATSVFAIILFISSTTLIGITQTYIKASVQDQAQQSANDILSDISEDLQYSQTFTSVSGANNEYWFCIGNDVFLYNLDMELSSKVGGQYSNWGLIRYSGTCPSVAPANPYGLLSSSSVSATELLTTNERIGQLTITPDNVSNNPNVPIEYTIQLEIGYGDNDLLNDIGSSPVPNGSTSPNDVYNYQCQSGSDSSFCGVANLSTTVAPRITN